MTPEHKALVDELLAIDEAAMYERPATTRATIERAATALAEQAARIAELEVERDEARKLAFANADSAAEYSERFAASRAECEGLRAALDAKKSPWDDTEMEIGQSYRSLKFGLVTYKGFDDFHGQRTHWFRTGLVGIHRDRYILLGHLNDFLEPKSRAALSQKETGDAA